MTYVCGVSVAMISRSPEHPDGSSSVNLILCSSPPLVSVPRTRFHVGGNPISKPSPIPNPQSTGYMDFCGVRAVSRHLQPLWVKYWQTHLSAFLHSLPQKPQFASLPPTILLFSFLVGHFLCSSSALDSSLKEGGPREKGGEWKVGPAGRKKL